MDGATESLVKLQLDAETGEMVSKSELKKRLQKRAKKNAKAAEKEKEKEKADATVKKPPKTATGQGQSQGQEVDVNAMFKRGFLADVFNERPSTAVRTRFPPEPNGFLHLGHAKAICVNFGFARFHKGECILRFDDTNPDAEEADFFHAIEDMVAWLGFKPARVTYSSDNFGRLYDLAEDLIRRRQAYVCHCSDVEIKKRRGGENGELPRSSCDHADQDVETNLQKFRDMRDGKYEPAAAVLRMKQDILGSGNPQMWDLAAYRIPKNRTPHFRTRDEWSIYPTYDFAHCLCDSIENITHSLCTTEFITARESYDWLINALEVYAPMQREYGRLNVEGTIMSKRALKKLVESGIVRGWDDPRLYTLIAIRRRGIPPGAILSFINELGVTTSLTVIRIARFEQSVRRYLETSVPRLLLVLDPIRVVIQDIGQLDGEELDMPLSKDPSMGSYKVRLTRTVYIDRSDFRKTSHKDFFRLSPGTSVGLLQVPYPIKAVSFSEDETTGLVTEVIASLDTTEQKPKAYIHWVPEGSRSVTARVYQPLFKSENPTAVEGGFLADINPNSETVYSCALVNSGFDEVRRRAPWPKKEAEKDGPIAPEDVRFQAMRVSYFAMDKDSTEDNIILNSIVALKEDANKQ
ncbi:glutaminyl-tRNA synthetase [Xylaria cf. heliscus]|nr:glutaminyl-tRNA synthetase [Xylaria cf. heliscus]